MTKPILSEKTIKFNLLLKTLADYINLNEKKLVYWAYDNGATYDTVAELLGISRQAVNQKYPKKKGEHEK